MYGCFILCRCGEGQESGSWVRPGTSESNTAAALLLLLLQGVERGATLESRCKQEEKTRKMRIRSSTTQHECHKSPALVDG